MPLRDPGQSQRWLEGQQEVWRWRGGGVSSTGRSVCDVIPASSGGGNGTPGETSWSGSIVATHLIKEPKNEGQREKGGAGRGREGEEKPYHRLLLGTVRGRVLLEGPRFLGTQRAVWRETSELEAGLNTLSPRKLGGNKGGAEAFSPEASGAFSWAGSLPGRRGNSLQRDYLPVLSISSAKSTLRAQSSSLNSLNNWPPPGLRWRFSITGIRKVTSCFRPRLLCYSWKGG